MTWVEKIVKEAREEGKKVPREVVTGLKAIERMHELTKKVKGSPSKILEELHHPARHK